MNQKEIDILLFNYLEDNLSPKEKQEFEDRLKQSPELRKELEYWKVSFIEQPVAELKSTKHLKKKGGFNWWWSLTSIPLFLLLWYLYSSGETLPEANKPVTIENKIIESENAQHQIISEQNLIANEQESAPNSEKAEDIQKEDEAALTAEHLAHKSLLFSSPDTAVVEVDSFPEVLHLSSKTMAFSSLDTIQKTQITPPDSNVVPKDSSKKKKPLIKWKPTKVVPLD